MGADLVPTDAAEKSCTYLCGNSLGPLPKKSAEFVREELDVWGSHAVEGHFSHPKQRDWKDFTDLVNPSLARLIGANDNEVACMGTLTSNLHLLMNTFYKPTSTRYKILCEYKAFPSDQVYYAFASQAALHGLDPEDTVLELHARAGEFTLREADILEIIKKEGQSIAMVLFSGVQYYTGQCFPMEAITKAAHDQGCICGWDLAHAIGNVPMSLHVWGADFAVWCSYKYLNSGPGGIGGLFIHEQWDDREKPRYAGWWGHDPQTRFLMPPRFNPIRGAQGFAQSNPSVFAIASLLGSLQVFQDAGGFEKLRAKSIRLTSYLEQRLRDSKYFLEAGSGGSPTFVNSTNPCFTIITPSLFSERGSQLSLLFFPAQSGIMQKIDSLLKRQGVVGDERQPDVIRLAPNALYNTFDDCMRAALALDKAFQGLTER
ncbi:kynureninase [Ramaria rubella]|nr:kynureninase [Ramaria rubella]